MLNEELLQTYFQVLGDQSRLKIIKTIRDNELSVGTIVQKTGLSQALVSHHLKILWNENILKKRRSGPFIYYSLVKPELLDLLKSFEKMIGKKRPRAAKQAVKI